MGLLSTTHIHQGRTDYVPFCKEVNIKEIKAPTDESLRLLNEMQEKAHNNIIKTIEIKENFLNAVAVFYRNEIIMDRIDFHARFMLNGKEYLITESIDKSDFNIEVQGYMGLNSERAYKFIIERYAKAISEDLFNQIPNAFNI